ncbi:MAG: VWA domain-containing protein [Calditrichaceae bacterium]
MFRFADPAYLLLLLILPGMVYWYIRGNRKNSGKMKYSDVGLIKRLGSSAKQRLYHTLFLARLIAFTMLILALARPQSSSREELVTTEGVDIVMAMDVSSSMLAEDFKPNNRLEAAKNVAEDFIKGRKNDRLGMVVFAGESFTQCPLTLDYGVLLTLLEEVKVADKDWDGTAIGMGIVNAANRLRDSKAKSKVVILLTDGVNNRGQVDPITAARIAHSFGLKIYTIGAGKQGTAMYPVDDPIFGRRYVPMEVEIDEQVLREIAGITGGKYFRATDERKLKEIYDEIGEMEQTKIDVNEFTRYEELFIYYLGIGLVLLIAELILSNTYFRKLP